MAGDVPETGVQKGPAPAIGQHGPKTRGFPRPPLGEWVGWIWDILERYRLLKSAAIFLAALFAALLAPLAVSWTLMIAALLDDYVPVIGRIRDLYVATVQEGFQILHTRIDYVHSFELELGGTKPSKWVVVSDLERGQYVEVVLRRIKIVPLQSTANAGIAAAAAPKAPASSVPGPSSCSLAPPARSGGASAGVLKVSLSGVTVRSELFKETDEALHAVPLDADWWQKNSKEVAKLDPLDIWFEAGNIGDRTIPAGCGTLVVEGKIRVYKKRYPVPRPE